MTKPFHIGLFKNNIEWTGGNEYFKNIIFALKRHNSNIQISLITNKSENYNFIEAVKPLLKKVYFIEEEIPPIPLITLWNQIKKRIFGKFFQLSDNRLDVFLKKKGFDFVYPYFSSQKKVAFKQSAAWIPDFQHKYLTEYFTDQEIIDRDTYFGLIAKHSPVVVLSSKSAEADFKKFYPQFANKTQILPFRCIPDELWYDSDPLETQKKYCLPDKFFILSNQFWQHKNHLSVFDALKQLSERAIYPIVVCTGHIHDYRKPEYSDTILQTIHQFGLAQQVFLLGLIPKIDQIQLLRRSISVIQPSFFEGWNTVVEEARCMAKPLILSDIPVHIEQDPPKAKYFDHHSIEDLSKKIADVWQSCSPVTNMNDEFTARSQYEKEIHIFAERFMEIVKQVQSF